MYNFLFRTLPLSFFNLFRLFLFVICLLPGFTRFAWYYFVASDRISTHYGNESIRQRIDVYRSFPQPQAARDELLVAHGGSIVEDPQQCANNAPVILFCTGGGWMIGYKMWGSLLARALTAAGIVVVIPDMRNYPLAYVPSMVDDVDAAIDWTLRNIAQYGGDPTNVVLVGQSAGGHVACMAMFRKIQGKLARQSALEAAAKLPEPERRRELQRISQEEPSWNEGGWSASDLRGFAAISSPLSLGSTITESFQRLGFDDAMVHRMFGFEKERYDPYLALQNLRSQEERDQFVKELPPIAIYQGTEDKTVPFEVSEDFYRKLRQLTMDHHPQIPVSFVPYVGWSHTDPILEGPMDADQRLHKDLFDDVNEWTTTSSPKLTWPDDPRVNDRLCPHFLVKLSRIVNPF